MYSKELCKFASCLFFLKHDLQKGGYVCLKGGLILFGWNKNRKGQV